MAASMQIRAFWDIAPCSVVVVDRRFRGAYCLYYQGYDPWNIGLLQRDFTVRYPVRLKSSYSSPRVLEISHLPHQFSSKLHKLLGDVLADRHDETNRWSLKCKNEYYCAHWC